MRLISADNRFLQEELEKRDRMLGKLTEGLREVEVVQINYQQENIRLKESLEKAKSDLDMFLQENQDIAELRLDLEVALQENRRLATENGRLSKYVRELDKVLTYVGGVGSSSMSTGSHENIAKREPPARPLTPQRAPLVPVNSGQHQLPSTESIDDDDMITFSPSGLRHRPSASMGGSGVSRESTQGGAVL